MTRNILFKHICMEDTYMFNYTQLPDELFTIEQFMTLSLHAKVLYSFMLRRVSISKDHNWIDEAGDVYIYYRIDEIMQKFNCSNKTATKIMAELEEFGLIEKKRQGQGKPDIIYVNKFSAITEEKEDYEEPELPIEQLELLSNESGEEKTGESVENSEVNNLHFKKCKNYTSKNVKSTSLEVKNLHASYKENNYTEKGNSSSLSPPDINHEHVRLMEEEEEKRYKTFIKYQEAERVYSAKIAAAAYTELMKREEEYRKRFNADMFLRICKSVSISKEPIISMPGFINWCLDNISSLPRNQTNQFCQFPQRDDYDFDALEKEILNSGGAR